ncbi:hypothetical protein ACLB2K_026040 [Fragaria x ananassa]
MAPKLSYMSQLVWSGITSNTKTTIYHRLGQLSLSYDYLEIMSEIYVKFGGLPFSFGKLKTLILLYEMEQRYLLGLACLLKSSPVIHTLEIRFSMSSGLATDKWNILELDLEAFIPFLSHLEVIEISLGYIISENAITFPKFVLKYGTGLQNLTLNFWRSQSSLPPNSIDDTVALLQGFPRASANVKLSTFCF